MTVTRTLEKKFENAQINIDGTLHDVMLAKFKQVSDGYKGAPARTTFFVSPSKFMHGNKQLGPGIRLQLPIYGGTFSKNGYMPTEDEIRTLFKGGKITCTGLKNSKESNFARDVKFEPLAKVVINGKTIKSMTGQTVPLNDEKQFSLKVLDTIKDATVKLKGKTVVTDLLKIQGRNGFDYYTTEKIDASGVKVEKDKIRLYIPIMGKKGFKPNKGEVQDFFAGKVVHGVDMHSVKNPDTTYEADLKFDPLADTGYKFSGDVSFVDNQKSKSKK